MSVADVEVVAELVTVVRAIRPDTEPGWVCVCLVTVGVTGSVGSVGVDETKAICGLTCDVEGEILTSLIDAVRREPTSRVVVCASGAQHVVAQRVDRVAANRRASGILTIHVSDLCGLGVGDDHSLESAYRKQLVQDVDHVVDAA